MLSTISFILLIIDSFLVIKILKTNQFHKLLKMFWAISFFGWNATPYLLSLLPQYRGDISIDIDFYFACWSINFFFLFIVYLSAYLFGKIKWKKKSFFDSPSYQYNPRFINMMAIVSIVVLVLIIIVGLGDTSTYAERNDVSNHDDNLLLGTLSSLKHFAANFLLAIIFFYRKIISRPLQYVILAVLSTHYFLTSLGGSRIHLFAIVIMLLYIVISEKRKILIVPVLALGIIALSVLPAIKELRKTGDIITTKNVYRTSSKESGDIMWEIMNKTNSVHSSSVLLFYSGIGSGGSLVYTSTLYSLVPRFIYPNKPHPGSMNGTMDGLPGRLAANIASSSYNSVANVGISTSIESLWAGGYIMYLIQAIFSGFLIVLMNKAFHGKKLLLLYFVLSLLSFPVCIIDVSLVNFSISIQRFLVVYALFYLLFSTQFKKYSKWNS